MIRNFIITLSFLAALSTSGIPLALLQVGVWTNMFEKFHDETDSIITSATWVFDGNHRCLGCEFVSALSDSANENLAEGNVSFEKNSLLAEKFTKICLPRSSLTGNLHAHSKTPPTPYKKTETPPPRFAV
jgi:hypothetical protein